MNMVADLEGFVFVAQAERLIDAAAHLGITQPTLSRRLQRVEAYAGAPLFERTGRSLRLNSRGRAFLARAEAAVAHLRAGQDEVARLLDPERGTIRLDFMHSLGTWLVPELISSYRAAHPQVGFDLHQGAAQELSDRVRQDEADLALVGPRPGPDLDWHPLRRQRLALAIPAGHRLALEGADRPVRLAEAAEEPFIGMRPGYGTRILLDELATAAGVRPHFVFESMELTTVIGLVAAGLGVALLPLDDPYLSPADVVLRPLDPPAYRELGVVWRRGVSLAPPAAQLREFIRAKRG